MTDSPDNRNKPFWVIVLIILIIFQSISALYGGIALIIDPEGRLLQMPVTKLQHGIFNNFLIPGLCLFLFLGVFPAFTAICLIFRPKTKRVNALNIYKSQDCGWTYALFTGLMLFIWITIQIALVGYGHIIQTIYASLGILITIITLIPKVMRYYQKQEAVTKRNWRTL